MFDLPPIQPSFEVSVATDGVDKGLSQTNSHYQVVGRARVDAGPAFAELRGKNINDTVNGADAEFDVAVGASRNLLGFDLDGAVVYKNFANTKATVLEHEFDVEANAVRTFGPVSAKLSYTFSPDAYGAARTSHYVEGTGAIVVLPTTRVSASVGRRVLDSAVDYTAWNVGVTQKINKTFAVDLRYYNTDRNGDVAFDQDRYGNRVVAAVRAKF